MPLKRKIRFANLPGNGGDQTASGSAETDPIADDSMRPSEDPFAFPGTNSETSSIAGSEGTNPPKMARLVLKLGSSKRSTTPVAAPLVDALRSPSRDFSMTETTSPASTSRSSPEKKRSRKKKPKNPDEEISVQVGSPKVPGLFSVFHTFSVCVITIENSI
jgi:hypothetical protein